MKLILLLNQSNRLVQPKMNHRNTFSDAPLLEEEEPSSPKSTISLVFTGKHWEIPLDSQDLDKEEFNPKITSSPLPG